MRHQGKDIDRDSETVANLQKLLFIFSDPTNLLNNPFN
jgi:hypothetical protein